ncbi:PAS domain-containing response regulator [Desulfoferrobacter suflitae]|uniref:PAS domain-containing response regulator n=1 Tax=Desulfoferrobacter suflitae TaxID=2865782 RepID=UPI002164E3C8|nr:response regulator [Desulfoferrobacter suflitae]MCK8603502.1 response regulator [Desulfoferrobacter suflitae]
MDSNAIKSVLVVDDEEGYRRLLQTYMEVLGLACDMAAGGNDATAMLHCRKYDLLISDIRMPGKDGLTLTREAVSLQPHLAVIIMTGYANDYTYSDIISAGAADFIVKPFEIDELKAKVERIDRERRIVSDLLQAKNDIEYVFDNTVEAISFVDRHGRPIRWNKVACDTFGYSRQEMQGRKVFDLYPDKDALAKMLEILRREGSVKRYEIDMINREGRIAPFEVSIRLVKNSKGETTGSVAVAMDLSELKKAMADLKQANQQLRQEVSERKRVEEQLRQAQEQLRQLLEERTAKLSKAGEVMKRSIDRFKSIAEE